MVKPISPNEIVPILPDFVVEAVNTLLNKKFNKGRAFIKQTELVQQIRIQAANAQNIAPTAVVFDNAWLNVEEVYRHYGWNVVYDKPGFNESYEASYTFEAK